jgi:hypothetical protein
LPKPSKAFTEPKMMPLGLTETELRVLIVTHCSAVAQGVAQGTSTKRALIDIMARVCRLAEYLPDDKKEQPLAEEELPPDSGPIVVRH